MRQLALEWGVTPVADPGVRRRRGALDDVARGRARGRARRARRPRRDHRRHRGEHPGLDERDQGRHRVGTRLAGTRTAARGWSLPTRRVPHGEHRAKTSPTTAACLAPLAARSARSCSSRSSTTARCSSAYARRDRGARLRPSARPRRARARSTMNARRSSDRLAPQSHLGRRARRPRGARARLRPSPGERLFIVKGIRRMAASGSGASLTSTHATAWPLHDRADRRAPDRPRAARVPPRRGALPVRPPGGHRAEPVRRRDGEPFPTTYYVTCRHLVAAISRLEAAGGVERWTRARRDDPELAASLARADDEQRAHPPRARGRRDRPRRRHVARPRRRRRRPRRARSSACTPTRRSRSRSPGYELGERIVAELEPLWPDRGAAPER